ncbi:CU044_5270 family protein [Pseudonocardia sp. TRM90224]|uniref:CU044_5270 family protein n=1 Tax=Pseudonocardia sp. TRM90224 TaxID=2812678 RepID=UPI001E4437EC|nr:CU044_5270 family protein [Pseudonocardia sp. TRM90224]
MNTHHSLQRLADARPPQLDPRPDPGRRRRDLERAFATDRPSRLRRPANRRPMLIAAVGLAAAAAVGIPLLGQGAFAPSSSGPTIVVSAPQVLLAAAMSAEALPATDGAFWRSSELSSSVFRTPGPGGYLVEERHRFDTWTAKSPTDPGAWISTNLGAAPLSPADEEAWRNAGAPDRFTEALCVPREPCTERVVPAASEPPLAFPVEAGDGISPAQLQQLPTDQEALREHLLKSYTGDNPAAAGDPMDPDTWLFTTGSGLIMKQPVRPEVRAAAFRMLAALPGMTVDPHAHDVLGRAGTAVSMRQAVEGGGVLEHRVLIDVGAGIALGEETVVVEPIPGHTGLPPAGQRWHSTVVESVGWTDERPPAVPDGR